MAPGLATKTPSWIHVRSGALENYIRTSLKPSGVFICLATTLATTSAYSVASQSAAVRARREVLLAPNERARPRRDCTTSTPVTFLAPQAFAAAWVRILVGPQPSTIMVCWGLREEVCTIETATDLAGSLSVTGGAELRASETNNGSTIASNSRSIDSGSL